MQTLNLSTAHDKILGDIRRYLEEVRSIARQPIDTIERGILTLQALRKASYEDLNQIQHEYTALIAVRWLIDSGHVPDGVAWQWNPRQTGGAIEPDIRAVLDRETIISAEVTTSSEPVGAIDTRMASTLQKLAAMEGSRFYFVVTAPMARRARTKTEGARYDICVVRLEPPMI